MPSRACARDRRECALIGGLGLLLGVALVGFLVVWQREAVADCEAEAEVRRAATAEARIREWCEVVRGQSAMTIAALSRAADAEVGLAYAARDARYLAYCGGGVEAAKGATAAVSAAVARRDAVGAIAAVIELRAAWCPLCDGRP
ncbi:MAG TPA: hypothetical protein VFX50_09075 [Gemmatimonadales bacterium]|nr:hypothetical protein [Gemmatimonadales bacterium]